MRKLITTGLIIATLGVSGNALANTPPDKPTGSITGSSAATMPASIINDISVPYEVLMYAQLQYEGSAVTKADKINRDGKELYRLRVDKDDVADDYNSIYLIYDMKWLLVGEEKGKAPPVKKIELAPAPKPTEVTPTQPAPTATQEPAGGRGADTGSTQELAPSPDPSATTDPPTTDPGSTP